MIRSGLILGTVLVALLGSALAAQPLVWAGGTSSAWETASNWVPAIVPTATNSVVIPDSTTTANSPQISGSEAVGKITIEPGGSLSMAAASELAVSGDFVNNGDFTAGTGVVSFVGNQQSRIGGNSPTTFYRLIIDKDDRAVEVRQTGVITISGSSVYTAPNFDLVQGTYHNDGYDLTCTGDVGRSTTGQAELHVSGGDVSLVDVHQFGGLRQFTVTGGTVAIHGRHGIAHSGQRFDMSGGTVTYTATGSAMNLRVFTNGSGWGYYMTGGRAVFYGTIALDGASCYLVTTGSAQVEMTGEEDSAIILRRAHNSANAANVFRIADLIISKSNNSIVTLDNAENSFPNRLDSHINRLEVQPGCKVQLFGELTPGVQWILGDIVNEGVIDIAVPALSIVGDIVNEGSLEIAAQAVSIAGDILGGPTSSFLCDAVTQLTGNSCRITGDASFPGSLSVSLPGFLFEVGAGDTLTIAGTLQLEGTLGLEVLLRSTNTGTTWNLVPGTNVVAEFVDVQDSNASSSVTVSGGIDSGNNTNWTFGPPTIQYIEWSGILSGDWDTAGNWSSNTVPTAIDNVVIPDAATTTFSPTLAAGSTVQSMTIESGGTLNGGTGDLTLTGHWINNGSYVPGSATIEFTGQELSVIGGNTATTMHQLRVNKSGRNIFVTQMAELTLTATGATAMTMPVNIVRGTLFNNGFDLSTSNNGRIGSSTPSQGELHISGGMVSLGSVYQWNQLKQFTITGGDVTIHAEHSVVNSEHGFLMTGGTLTYTGAADNLYLSNAAQYVVTGGSVSFHANLRLASNATHFRFIGDAEMVFAGTGNSTFNMRNGIGDSHLIEIHSLRVEKPSAVATFDATNDMQLDVRLGNVTVQPGAELRLNQAFETGRGYFIEDLEVGGTFTANAEIVYIRGDIAVTGVGVFNADASNTIYLIGGATTRITGDVRVNNIVCDTPGRRIEFGAGDTFTVAGSMLFTGALGNQIVLRSTSTGTRWNLQVLGHVEARFCDVQDGNASVMVFAVPGGIDSGNNNNWRFTDLVLVTALAGVTGQIWSNETGGGDGVVSGTFTVLNDQSTATTITEIVLEADGTGNHQLAYTEVALYLDNVSTGVQGNYDPADVLIGTAVSGFTAAGIASFTANVNLSANEEARIFVVVKFNGPEQPAAGNTFQVRVGTVSVTSGPVAGTPSQLLPGFSMRQAECTISTPPRILRPVTASYTGPGGNGFQFGTFAITNTSPQPVPVDSLQIHGTTNPSLNNIFTRVELWWDENESGAWDRTEDVLIQGHDSWSTPQDFNFTGPAATLGPNETRTFFIVVKLNGPGTPSPNQQLGFWISGNSNLGLGHTFVDIPATLYTLRIENGGMYVQAEHGEPRLVLGTESSQILAGRFHIHNSAPTLAGNLTGITLRAGGSGDDSGAYSQVAIYHDANRNGTWDLSDPLFGTAATAFPSDNGALTFTVAQALAVAGGSTESFFVVVRMDGTTPATVSETFTTRVEALTTSYFNDGLGLPSSTMGGVEIVDIALSVDITVGTAQRVWTDETGPSGNGQQLATFEIAAAPAGSSELESITIAAFGSSGGISTTAFDEVMLYQGVGADFDFSTDTLVDGVTGGFGNRGELTFTLDPITRQFSASESRRYFLVGKLGGSAIPNATFQFRVMDIQVAPSNGKGGIPSPMMAGIVIETPVFDVTDYSPAAATVAVPDGEPRVIQQFEIEYPEGPPNAITGVTLTGVGSFGTDLQADISRAELWVDANQDGIFDPADDILLDTIQGGFNPQSQLAFTVPAPHSDYIAPQARAFFIALVFEASARHGGLYQTQLVGLTGVRQGTDFNSLPAPAGGPAPGLEFYANDLIVTLNGPGTPTTVDSNSQGPGGAGHVIWDGTLAPVNDAWTVNELVFQAAGTADGTTAFSELALYEDTNDSGDFDSGDLLAVAAAVITFDTANTYTAVLLNDTVLAGTSRRFFLVGKLSGTASTGQTLNARLDSLQATAPIGGQVQGDVGVDSTALIIDVATITLRAGPSMPEDALRRAGQAFAHTIGHFRLTATNQDAIVTGVSFDCTGTGNWDDYLDPVNGIQVYSLPVGNTFDSASATLLFEGGGASLVLATFLTPVVIDNSEELDLWVVLNIMETAGLNESIPRTLLLGVSEAQHIQESTGMTPLLGTPVPQSDTLSIVDFFVSRFQPGTALPGGGQSITITGSGFMQPFSVTIGGVLCPGIATIDPEGTEVKGLIVPQGTGHNLEIVVQSGPLGALTLSQAFRYGNPDLGDSSDGCAAGSQAIPSLLLLLALAAIRRRRRVG
jgi:hypothetical protein